MNATIYDVASRAGVSISTVSRALNEPHRVQGATLQRIQHAIDDLGFVPKAEATARARRLHRQIGILAPFVTHYPSFTQRMRGIAAALLDTGYELVVYNADTPEHVRGYLHSVPVSRRLDGLILISLVVDDATVERMSTYSFPAVMIEATHPSMPGVDIDNVGGGRLAAEYLVSRGHRRIGFVGGDRQLGPMPWARAGCASGALRTPWPPRASCRCTAICRRRPPRPRMGAVRRWRFCACRTSHGDLCGQ